MSGWIAGGLDDLAAADPQVFHLAVDTVGGVVDVAAGDEEVFGHLRRVQGSGFRKQRSEVGGHLGGQLTKRQGGCGWLGCVGGVRIQSEGSVMKSPFPGMDPYIEARF